MSGRRTAAEAWIEPLADPDRSRAGAARHPAQSARERVRGPRRRRWACGQASIELLACIPVLVLAGLLAWQLAAVIAAGIRAEERVRADAIDARAGSRSGIVTVRAEVLVPQVLPGVRGLRLPARAAIRAR